MSIISSNDRAGVLIPAFKQIALGGMVVLAIAIALTLGRYPITLADIGRFILASLGLAPQPREQYDLLFNIIVEIRLPRVVAASLVGAALASSGAAYQAVFRNPLVSSDILGVLGGASLGAALGLFFGGSWMLVEILAFLMGLCGAGLSIIIANLFGSASIIMLVLGGLISSALFAALLSIVKYLADPYNQLPQIIYWLMGSFANANLNQLAVLAPIMISGIIVLGLLGRALDALSMGDDEAQALGVPVTLVRYGVIFAATLISAMTVSIAGMIGWIGLFIPHFARLLMGPSNVGLVAASAAFGAIFLLAADALARSIGAVEIPIGIITELLGIPAFLLVLSPGRAGYERQPMLKMEDGPALCLRNLHFSYHGRIVLDGAGFSMDHGEIVSLLAANGAGKSTLLRLAIGLIKPSSGEVLLQGHPIKNLTRKAIARSLAYVPQAHVAPFPFEVREVVMLGRLAENGLFRGPSQTDRMIVTQSLEQLGIAHLAQRPYTQVSGGERQLALIARALAQGARLLVLDEPATGLDYGHQVRLLQKLKQLRGEGFGILMTTHHPDHAVSVSTRIIALKHGRIMHDGAPSDVVTSDTIFELYGVQVANPQTIAVYE